MLNFPNVGKMDNECPMCGALKFKGEKPGICCSGGKVRIPILDGPSQPLRGLLTGETEDSRHFLKNIRHYNHCFSMTSMGGENIGGWSTYKVQGAVHHSIGSLLPPEDKDPRYLQIYFMQTMEDQARQRKQHNGDCKEQIILDLQEQLYRSNPYVQEFTSAMERMTGPDMKIIIQEEAPMGEHARRYNAPTASDVGIILKTDVGPNSHKRDIILEQRSKGLVRINETHRSYDPLMYPLMMMHGEDGYHFHLPLIDPKTGEPLENKKVSCQDFYSSRLMVRKNASNHLLDFRDLTNQFATDCYAKCESERLRWCRLNQQTLRVTEYQHLRDAVLQEGLNPDEIGKATVLPSSFIGGPRYMNEKNQVLQIY